MVNVKFRFTHSDFRRSFVTICGFRLCNGEPLYPSYLASRRLAFRPLYRTSSSLSFWWSLGRAYHLSGCSLRCIPCKRGRKESFRSSPVCYRRFVRIGRYLNESFPSCQCIVFTMRWPLGALGQLGERHQSRVRMTIDAISRVFWMRRTGCVST